VGAGQRLARRAGVGGEKAIATQVFAPKAAELAAAVREADKTLRRAHDRCEQLVDFVRRADAVLLEFAWERWRAPYLARYRALAPRMLALHEVYGDNSASFLDARDRARAEFMPDDG
jgi:hypothetical protein